MQELAISVTAAARKFSDCVNRVRYQSVSFLLHKNGVPVARIVPVDSSSGMQLEQLAVALRQARQDAFLDDEEAAAPQSEPEEHRAIHPTPRVPKPPLLNW